LDPNLLLFDPKGNRLVGKAEKRAFVLAEVGPDDFDLVPDA
jgi:hypothetical protein